MPVGIERVPGPAHALFDRCRLVQARNHDRHARHVREIAGACSAMRCLLDCAHGAAWSPTASARRKVALSGDPSAESDSLRPARMRVCLVYDCLFPHTVGGAERWYRNLAERLATDGHEVIYLTLRQWERGEDPGVAGVDVRAAGPRMALYAGPGRRRDAAAARVRRRRAVAPAAPRPPLRRRPYLLVSILLAAGGSALRRRRSLPARGRLA